MRKETFSLYLFNPDHPNARRLEWVSDHRSYAAALRQATHLIWILRQHLRLAGVAFVIAKGLQVLWITSESLERSAQPGADLNSTYADLLTRHRAQQPAAAETVQ